MHSHSHELLTLFGRERAVIVGRREVASDGRGSVPYRDEQEAHGKKGGKGGGDGAETRVGT